MNTTISNSMISVEIDSKGAELIQIKKNTKQYIWDIDTKFWNKTSPILFPIVGRLKNDIYTIEDDTYSLPRHGFARDCEFKISNKKETSIEFLLSENKETLQQFPFEFELKLKYILENNSATLKYTVTNNSEVTMPFSIGAHPAFAIDITKNNYQILFDNDSELITHELENEQFSGKSRKITLENQALPLSYALFEKDALVFKNLNSRSLIIFENGNPYLKIHLGNFPHLGIWTKPNAPFLCIEPWFGYADSVNSNGSIFEKKAIQQIEPKQTFECYFTIEIL